eukprot:TRINITY_DN371_c0_g2_i2.p1 TRINITY_DN371_c0_g2~~TRINITY_DN371_c0_g2_i2.p1  ORF type:complete len:165 (+),score=32.26 TRINITY_DN371_c0_g2_i2:713-1207(+)
MVRFKNRYLLSEIIVKNDKPIDKEHLSNAIKESILNNFGDYGRAIVSKAFLIKDYNVSTGIFVVRCGRDSSSSSSSSSSSLAPYSIVWSSLTLITKIREAPVLIRVLHVGGTIRSCQKVAVSYNKAMMRLFEWKEEAEDHDDDNNNNTLDQLDLYHLSIVDNSV